MFSRQEYWSGLPCPPPGDLPNPGIEPISFTSPALTGGLFTSKHQIAFIKLPPCTLRPFFTFDQTILFLQIALSPDGLGKTLEELITHGEPSTGLAKRFVCAFP